jgi:hypothetical protein
LNSEMGNKPFSEKKEKLYESQGGADKNLSLKVYN